MPDRQQPRRPDHRSADDSPVDRDKAAPIDHALKASDIASMLHVTVRQVQYLREVGIVVPFDYATGRGTVCRYNKDDFAKCILALEDLKYVDFKEKKKIVEIVFASNAVVVEYPLTKATVLRIHRYALHSRATDLLTRGGH